MVVDGGEGGGHADVGPPDIPRRLAVGRCQGEVGGPGKVLLQSGFAVTYSMHAMKHVSLQKSRLKNHKVNS